MRSQMAHRWSEEDDLAALYVFRFGTDRLPYSPDTIAKRRGIEPGSFRMRVGNFKAIAGEGGLRNFARQSLQIYRRYGHVAEPELRALAFPELRREP
jgi:hypothetical protein